MLLVDQAQPAPRSFGWLLRRQIVPSCVAIANRYTPWAKGELGSASKQGAKHPVEPYEGDVNKSKL